MEEAAKGLPPGLRFEPSDEELIEHYLKPWLCCQELPFHIIDEADLYDGLHPDLLTALYPPKYGNGSYFFSQVTPISSSKKRLKRSTETGQWKISQKKEIKDERNNKKGIMNVLNYYDLCGKSEKKKTNWIMHEYKIEEFKEATRAGDWVICKLYMHPSSKKSYGMNNIIASTTLFLSTVMGIGKEEEVGARWIPPGFKFEPSDEEIIKYYLKPWLRCQELPFDIIYKTNLYDGTHPSILSVLCPPKYGNASYFFTQVTPTSSSKKRLKRSTEIGQWKISQRKDIKYGRNKNKGIKNLLNYYDFCGTNEKKKTNWIMYEYKIESYRKATRVGDWALCKIYLYPSNKKYKDIDGMAAPTALPPQMATSIFSSGSIAFPQPYQRGGDEQQARNFRTSTLAYDYDISQKLLMPSYFSPSYSILPALETEMECHNQEAMTSFLSSSTSLPLQYETEGDEWIQQSTGPSTFISDYGNCQTMPMPPYFPPSYSFPPMLETEIASHISEEISWFLSGLTSLPLPYGIKGEDEQQQKCDRPSTPAHDCHNQNR